jgi:hypothetical protein
MVILSKIGTHRKLEKNPRLRLPFPTPLFLWKGTIEEDVSNGGQDFTKINPQLTPDPHFFDQTADAKNSTATG